MANERKAIIVGISGCSSSGKTTLARLLRDIFPNSFVLHEDDFYKPEDQLPVKDGLVDWDCPEAISVPDLERSLAHIRATGTFPVSHFTPSSPPRHDHGCPQQNTASRARSTRCTCTVPGRSEGTASLTTDCLQPDVDSKEDRNSVGQCPVSDAKIDAIKSRVREWTGPGGGGHAVLGREGRLRLCLLDGFLLYSAQMGSVIDLIDIKLFLLVSRARAAQRREARDGYATLEGFWKDPPGYVDKVVWPNYAEAHAWLFRDGNVEGELKRDVLSDKGIHAQLGKGLDIDMETTLEWAVDIIMDELGSFTSE